MRFTISQARRCGQDKAVPSISFARQQQIPSQTIGADPGQLNFAAIDFNIERLITLPYIVGPPTDGFIVDAIKEAFVTVSVRSAPSLQLLQKGRLPIFLAVCVEE